MADTLIDATLLIDAVNKHSKAVSYLQKLLLAGQAFTHAQVAAELLSGTRDAREQTRLLKFLRQFDILYPNEADFKLGLHFLTRFHLSHNLGFGDCLIGATALRQGLPVATINDRHFRLFPGLHVIRPY